MRAALRVVCRLVADTFAPKPQPGTAKRHEAKAAAACLTAGERTKSLADGGHVFASDANAVFLRPDGSTRS